jgi:hypothetical protein
MAKVTDRGSATPDDPIYSSGLTVGGKRFAASTPTLPPDTAGTALKGALPDAPKRADFPTQQAFEDAMGYWQSHVGRIKGLSKG